MTQDQIPRLLDAAVPPVPARLQRPPYEGIRRRARRNRTFRVGGAAALAVVAATAGVVAAVGPARSPSTVVGIPPTSEPAVSPRHDAPDPVTPRSLRVAQVDRAGTGLTLYVNPSPAQCRTFADAVATVDERVNDVVVSITGDGAATECERTMAAPIQVTLAQPLGDRTLWSDVQSFGSSSTPTCPRCHRRGTRCPSSSPSWMAASSTTSTRDPAGRNSTSGPSPARHQAPAQEIVWHSDRGREASSPEVTRTACFGRSVT